MKSVKKVLFSIFFGLLMAFIVIAPTKLSASSGNVSSPWVLVFDDQEVRVGVDSFSTPIQSSKFTLKYNDPSGQSAGGRYWLWAEDFGVIPYYPFVEDAYMYDGSSRTFYRGGLVKFQYELPDGSWGEVNFGIHRPLANRVDTNVVSGKYYYDEVSFRDSDTLRFFDHLKIKIYHNNNLIEDDYFWQVTLTDEGFYDVEIKDDITNETINYYFAIVGNAPVITVEDYIYGQTPVEIADGGQTNGGATVYFSSVNGSASMVYYYTSTTGAKEVGTAQNGFTFWRKGSYTVIVTDITGKMSSKSFTINSFDVLVDPVGAQVGSEVSLNGGVNGGRTLTQGYTRCLYLGVDAPSQSRLDYNFTSSNNAIATVSKYGTITGIAPGKVIITVTKKTDATKVAVIDMTVLPQSGQMSQIVLTTDIREVPSHNGTEVTSGLGVPGSTIIHVGYTRSICIATGPSKLISDYTWVSSDESIATISQFGTVKGLRSGVVTIMCVNKYNSSVVGVLAFIII